MDEEKILEQFRSVLKPQDCYGPVPQSEIEEAERALGVSFPLSYRVFLRHFGASWAYPPYEISGLSDTRSSDDETQRWSNVIDDTEGVRRVFKGDFPHPYVSISSDGSDYFYYLDTAHVDQEGESQVIVLGPGRDAEVVATSFLEFVLKTATGHKL